MPEISEKPERGIVAAACQVDGLTFSLPAPARHYDVLWSMESVGVEGAEVQQGFLDHRGVFVGRRAAMIVAHNWGQVSSDEFDPEGELFSEHIW